MDRRMVNDFLNYFSQSADTGTLVPLDYIESTGVQWLDTGWNPSGIQSVMSVDCKFKFNTLTNSEQDIFGVYTSDNYSLAFGSRAGKIYYWRDMSAWVPVSYDTTDPHVYHVESHVNGNRVCVVDETTYTNSDVPSGNWRVAVNVAIFSTTPSALRMPIQGNLYYLKIYADGSLVRDFVPMLRLEDNKPGLYDSVYKQFYVNKGTGEDFLWGPTSKTYVQDGLVNMWDGIDNAGFGVHSSSASVWKDLIGTEDGTIFEYGSWLSNGRASGVRTGVNKNTVMTTPGRWNGPYHVEIAGMLGTQSTITDSQYFKLGRYGVLFRGKNSGALHASINTTLRRTNNVIQQDIPLNVGMYIKDNNCDVYVNSIQSTWSNESGDSFTGESDTQQWLSNSNDGILYCVRRYNRHLTQAEIEHNYRIDKLRFGLP